MSAYSRSENLCPPMSSGDEITSCNSSPEPRWRLSHPRSSSKPSSLGPELPGSCPEATGGRGTGNEAAFMAADKALAGTKSTMAFKTIALLTSLTPVGREGAVVSTCMQHSIALLTSLTPCPRCAESAVVSNCMQGKPSSVAINVPCPRCADAFSSHVARVVTSFTQPSRSRCSSSARLRVVGVNGQPAGPKCASSVLCKAPFFDKCSMPHSRLMRCRGDSCHLRQSMCP